ncbi:MAG: CoB--CoM heterodisulfide reductase iron-sulfur subunit A family protein [Alphaproteobacteria bacterium]|uniref:CoB--CoM heterodisulfide reductase iron-sulfur subunit A family protein n=1 Tax=Candidatus Nitrobium versatile TaxID=2884831 RepID=A0A953J3S5_9BACT|nr:CoB--CoM heterodisulfide reductase iron-sulfur subunit A family protein [Candidatus Nitrobium versatile]
MKIGVYFCKCGTNISGKVDADDVRERIGTGSGEVHFRSVDFMCSEEGKAFLEKEVREKGLERVVVSACSPREHEATFMRVLAKAGLNSYLLQMVNAREQVAWVTEERAKATEKVARYINAAVRRVALHDPLEKKEVDACPDVLVIGAGPAGLKLALSMAEAGRKVVVVEKTPVIGGMPVRFEELFPAMECGPCMLEPVMGDVLHGEHAEKIELLTMAQVTDVVGSYGNFTVTIRQAPRYTDMRKCIGCAECIEPCPVSAQNEFNCGLSGRKAISFPFAGALPNAPFIDGSLCLRERGEECRLCKDACPMEDAIDFGDTEKILKRNVGAIVIAIGSGLYDCRNIPALGYGTFPDVYTGVEFERIMASNGPTEGEIRTTEGTPPGAVAIVHCVGSLDGNHKEYCSGVCCQYAFKFNRMIEKKLPGTKVYHLYKELALSGKEEFSLYQHARNNPDTTFIRYADIGDLKVTRQSGGKVMRFRNVMGEEGDIPVDMVILCPAVVPVKEANALGALLEAAHDRFGFFEELHGRMDSAQSTIKGVYLAGTCQAPMDIQKAMNQGMAVAGYTLSGLVAGRKIEINPLAALVDADRCSGCRVCISVCPYRAISYDAEKGVSAVNDLLCQGCGTCVAACPSGAATGNHFTTREIFAEIEGVLA